MPLFGFNPLCLVAVALRWCALKLLFSHPDVSFPALHYVILSVSAMHLGNGKDADSDPEEEVMALISMWCASCFRFGFLLLDGLVSALILFNAL